MNHFEKIAAQLVEQNLDAMLVTSVPGEFYAAGFHGEGMVVITPGETWYYTDSRYIEVAQQQVTGAHVAMIRTGQTYRQLAQEIVADKGIERMGFEDQYMSVAEYNLWKDGVTAQLVPASEILNLLRMVKDQGELAVMREAQRVTDEAFTEILNYIKPGVAECEIAAQLTYIMASKGAERNSFDPIVACGTNGSKPHAVPGKDLIQPGQFVTMDFGCVVGGYCSDMTRTVAVGQPTDEMKLVYDTVLKAQLAGIAAAHGGVTGAEVHNAGAKVIAEAGYGAYFGHGFGHSLGIEIHENPRFSPLWDKVIPSGACLSAEPGIYLPGKFGVRIEDVIMLTDDGCIDITNSPKELIVL
ncbi:MAG TPA: aminopeptidase P family protein [Candidatus Enterenecus stercoripullorum]|nr:aminopeptidase P family protein [Candidatus Enterenecus stercoripullorum]